MTTIPATKNEVVVARLIEIRADLMNIVEHLYIRCEYAHAISLMAATHTIDRVVGKMKGVRP